MALNEKQLEAFALIKEGHNVLITGSAGTGKTHLLKEIISYCKTSGKTVHITCTTGIACTHFPPSFNARTIHSWAGIEDGRYDSDELEGLIKSSPHFHETLRRITETDVLVLDEVSMLSQKIFEQLEKVCSIKDKSKVFGGIQLIFSGDFLQLPPVPNVLYGDEGQFCFESPIYSAALPHKIELTQVLRQQEEDLIHVIRAVSRGCLNENEKLYITENLSRPLSAEETNAHVTRLFANNYLVDDYNRQCLFKSDEQLYEYTAEDTGEEKYLHKLLAPKKLLLKVGCPVILLRNLSNKLVNGLQGTVTVCEPDGVVVNFHTAGVTTKINRVSLSGNP